MTNKQRRHNVTKAYGRSVEKLCKAVKQRIPGSDYLTNVTNEALYDMACTANRKDRYEFLQLDPDIVSKCGAGEFAVCRERLMLAVDVLSL